MSGKKAQPEDNKRTVDYSDEYPQWKDEMKSTYTILVPDMLPWHFMIMEGLLKQEGYNVVFLKNDTRTVIDEGLKHVHNDTCYPCLCVVGQFIDALKSGKYDPDHTAVMITQSGGGCRASNYIPLIRKALHAEFPNVPVISINFAGLEKDSSLRMSLSLMLKLAFAVYYGDSIMWCYNQVKPYEINAGEADAVRDTLVKYVVDEFARGKHFSYRKINRRIIHDFAGIKIRERNKIKVGIVGEIYVKYSYLGNNHLEDFLMSEDCEPVVPALMDYVLYCLANNINDGTFYGHKGLYWLANIAIYRLARFIQKGIIKQFRKDGHFEPLHDFEHLRHCADKVLNQGVKMGEGWLIPAEMAALAETGTENIVCAQPFGCLPNHIAGKGAIRTLKNTYRDENIVAVDYDPSATRVNQENRIKLMLATARDNMAAKQAAKDAENA